MGLIELLVAFNEHGKVPGPGILMLHESHKHFLWPIPWQGEQLFRVTGQHWHGFYVCRYHRLWSEGLQAASQNHLISGHGILLCAPYSALSMWKSSTMAVLSVPVYIAQVVMCPYTLAGTCTHLAGNQTGNQYLHRPPAIP